MKKQNELEINGTKIPDPFLHKLFSFIKSGIRIIGYVYLLFDIKIAVSLLVFSEIVGILEELT